MKRCVTESCTHHHGKNPNGRCHADKRDIGNGMEHPPVFDFGRAGGSFCPWPERMSPKADTLF